MTKPIDLRSDTVTRPSTAMLEAMAWGLAPVVTPVGAIGEIVRDGANGLLVQPGDIAGLSAALNTILTDDDLRRRLGAQARATALEFGVGSYVEALAAHWRRLGEGRRSARALSGCAAGSPSPR